MSNHPPPARSEGPEITSEQLKAWAAGEAEREDREAAACRRDSRIQRREDAVRTRAGMSLAPRREKRPTRARIATQKPRTPRQAPTGRPPVIQTVGNTIACYLDEPPSANRWWRNVGGRMVLSREAREYKRMVELLGRASRVTPISKATPVRFDFFWHRGRKSGDLDKRLGVVMDALQGIAYENDSQIVEITARRDDVPYAFAVVIHITPAPLAAGAGG